jgi:hypothetical protein
VLFLNLTRVIAHGPYGKKTQKCCLTKGLLIWGQFWKEDPKTQGILCDKRRGQLWRNMTSQMAFTDSNKLGELSHIWSYSFLCL